MVKLIGEGGPYTANALRAGVDLVGAEALAPEFYEEIRRQILREDVRLGLGNLVRSAGGSLLANTLPSLEEIPALTNEY